MVQRTSSPIAPARATQRGGAASVPAMRTSCGSTATASPAGTPRPPGGASSDGWKSTRKAAQQAPQWVQGSSASDMSAHLLDNCQLSCTIPACHLLDNCQLCCVIPACSAGNNQAAEQHDSSHLSSMIIAC